MTYTKSFRITFDLASTNDTITLGSPVNRGFHFLMSTKCQHKSEICNFEKSSRSHRWTRLAALKSYQEIL